MKDKLPISVENLINFSGIELKKNIVMTPLFKKLNLKDQRSVHVVQAPDSFQAELKAISKTVSVATSLN